MQFCAPAKLILSGEHAVVHGAPALAMAVNYHATVEVSPLDYEVMSLSLPALNYHRSLDSVALDELSERIQLHYLSFQQNKCAIQEVLQHPSELIEYAIAIITRNYQIKRGMNLQLTSNIPIGCGMGSSAAAIASVMYAVTSCAGFNLQPDELYPLALTVENMQHGHSSGMDLQLSLRGGCYYRYGSALTPRPITSLPLYLVNTGTPQVTTGQCVLAVQSYFNNEKDYLLTEFTNVTNAMDQAWQTGSKQAMAEAIRANHDLLVRIGVVPEKVQAFIANLANNGAAAKICGAGAVSGEQGGVVLVLTSDATMLSSLCEQYGYTCEPVKGVTRGVHEV